jgi:hypothetical protein
LAVQLDAERQGMEDVYELRGNLRAIDESLLVKCPYFLAVPHRERAARRHGGAMAMWTLAPNPNAKEPVEPVSWSTSKTDKLPQLYPTSVYAAAMANTITYNIVTRGSDVLSSQTSNTATEVGQGTAGNDANDANDTNHHCYDSVL